MRRDYVTEIIEARSLAQARYVFTQLENALSPLELSEVADRIKSMPLRVRVVAQGSIPLGHIEREKPQRYRSTELCEGARILSDSSVARERKSLLMAFGGATGRVMLPMSIFAQMLPSERFDILLLIDRTNSSFMNGIEGLHAPFVQFVQRMAETVEFQRYASIYTFGTSIGGLPALRAGRQLGARRAIAVGPVFPWSIKLLQSSRGRLVSAFDSLCACGPGQDVECVAAFSAGHAKDRVYADRLARMTRVKLMPMEGYTMHAFLEPLYQEGGLSAFLGGLLDFDVDPVAIVSQAPMWLRVARRVRSRVLRGWRWLLGKPTRSSRRSRDRDQAEGDRR